MNVAKSMKYCMRLLRQRGLAALPKDIKQRRHYRSDDHNDWPAKRGEHAGEQINQIYGEDNTFDPRYDDRHYKVYRRNENQQPGDNSGQWNVMKETECRRRISQDAEDHKRHQERIILDNTRRWQQRSDPKSPEMLNYEYDQTVYGASGRRPKRREGEDQSAKEYSRNRRKQRLTEVKRQARELRESRKGYNLPKSEAQTETVDHSETPYASRAWLDKQAQQDEQKYWHTWKTCPDERRDKETAEDAAAEYTDDYAPGHKTNQRRGFVKPTLPYDSSVRRFQTHSRQLHERLAPPPLAPPKYAAADIATPIRRRPSGMDKQFRMVRDFTHTNRPEMSNMEVVKRSKIPQQSHSYKAPKATVKGSAQMLDIESMPQQAMRFLLARQGMPRPAYARFDDNNNRIMVQRKKARKCVEPPRLVPKPNKNILKRQRTPVDSFSNTLAVNTRFIPHSEYTGYGRQTVCDAWQNFTSSHNLSPLTKDTMDWAIKKIEQLMVFWKIA